MGTSRLLQEGSIESAAISNILNGHSPGSVHEPEFFDLSHIAICIADSTNRRLMEGIAVQLHLEPLFLSEEELLRCNLPRSVTLSIADELTARRFQHHCASGNRPLEGGMEPALVAVVSPGTAEGLLPPKNGAEQSFDGFIALPQQPATVLAQLSVILYAHRANVHRYESAMEELALNRRIFRSVTSGISVASATEPDFPLSYVNPAFEVMTGYSLEDIQGKNCRFLQRDERDQPGLVLIREALTAKRETVAILRNYKKDGTAFWNELSLSPIMDREGKVTHFVGIQSDVSARVAFEDALRESEKLAAVGRLAASIAHEINNPLEAVTNLLYLARTEESAPKKNTYLDQADEELQRAALLTHQSLRFYKQSSNPQAIRPSQLVSTVLDMYAVKMKNYGISVEKRSSTSQSIVCLESEIRQVVNNLIRNAMEAMQGKGGRILVRVHEATDTKTTRTGISIVVADTGTGMSEETKAKLCTAFYTTKGVGGTGLGLWVSSEIIERHHGRLRVRSRQTPGRSGTVFTLFLPYQAVTP